jgi:hypothetical protein
MKIKALLGFLVAVSFMIISGSAIAGCHWVRGYHQNGYYHQGHKVCTHNYYHHCRWVGGYRSNGYWHHSHKVCN